MLSALTLVARRRTGGKGQAPGGERPQAEVRAAPPYLRLLCFTSSCQPSTEAVAARTF